MEERLAVHTDGTDQSAEEPNIVRRAAELVESLIEPSLKRLNEELSQSEAIRIIPPGVGTTIQWGKQTANFWFSGTAGEVRLTVTLRRQPSRLLVFGVSALDEASQVPQQRLIFEPCIKGDEVDWKLGDAVMTSQQVVDHVLRLLSDRQ